MQHTTTLLGRYRALPKVKRALLNLLILLLAGFVAYWVFLAPPPRFPVGAYVTVEKGSTVTRAAEELKRRDIVRSAFLFKLSVRLLGDDTRASSGTYYFPQPQNLVTVAARLLGGDYGTTPIRITVPEGSTVNDISKLLLDKVPGFDRRTFLQETRGKEGYLFPDTYFFMPGDGTEAVLSVFQNSFHVHIAKIQKQIDAFGKPLSDVIIMASLLEKEAADTESRRVIAGILWNRIKKDMALQVDAVFPYIIGKNSFTLTKEDLQIDSLYNTYKYKGLPVAPIANPGLDSILAAVTPTKSNYVYYLSDLHGNFHYCASYSCHLANKHKYLD